MLHPSWLLDAVLFTDESENTTDHLLNLFAVFWTIRNPQRKLNETPRTSPHTFSSLMIMNDQEASLVPGHLPQRDDDNKLVNLFSINAEASRECWLHGIQV